MKLLIDISNDEYQRIKEYYEKNKVIESTYSYIYHGTPISDTLTNGDIILTMFPMCKATDLENNLVKLSIPKSYDEYFEKKWWNSLYNKEV
jgi:hypothetical protein